MTPHPEHVLDRLNVYRDGTLSSADVAIVRRHCPQCASCRAALETLSLERKSAAGSFARPLSAASRVFAFFWLTLAVAALVLAGFHVHYATLAPSPYDLRVLGQTEWLSGWDAALHLRVLRHDGGPERDVPVTVELTSQGPAAGRRVSLASLTTGDHGAASPRFHLPDWPDGSYQWVVTASPRGARGPETVTRTITLKHAWRLMTSTDKPVYQPGQVIQIRGLALSSALRAPSPGGRRGWSAPSSPLSLGERSPQDVGGEGPRRGLGSGGFVSGL